MQSSKKAEEHQGRLLAAGPWRYDLNVKDTMPGSAPDRLIMGRFNSASTCFKSAPGGGSWRLDPCRMAPNEKCEPFEGGTMRHPVLPKNSGCYW